MQVTDSKRRYPHLVFGGLGSRQAQPGQPGSPPFLPQKG